MTYWSILGAALTALALLSGCNPSGEKPVATATLPSVGVHTQTLAPHSRLATEDVLGTLRPRLSASISSKISGVVEQLPVVVGQPVQSGELLVQLDARETQARLDQAQAVREQSQKDLARIDSLLKQNIISQQEFDAAQAKFRVSDATVNENKTTLSHAKITAPFNGIITSKLADVGDLAAPGKVLVTLEDPATLRFEADIPETLATGVRLGDQMPVQLSLTNTPIIAVVSEIAPVADPNSRTFRVKFDLPGTTELRSGQFGRVAVPVGQVETLQVPTRAVLIRGQMELAFVMVKQQAQMRLIKTGKRFGDSVEIVSGLASGEALILDPPANMMDGQPVSIL
jgi:RND family efflux transporter MFP subunit